VYAPLLCCLEGIVENRHGTVKVRDRTCSTNSNTVRYDDGMPAYDGWLKAWPLLTDEELESAARDYIWLAQVSPGTDAKRRNEVIAEVERRGRPDILKRARKLVKRTLPWKNRAARKNVAP
jgi:hypothetical protein